MSQNTTESKTPSVEQVEHTSSPASGTTTPDSNTRSNTPGMFTILRPSTDSQSKQDSPKTDALDSLDPTSSLAKAMDDLEVDDDTTCDPDNPALDEFLVNALKNRQDRIFLLKLDREICSFINSPSQTQLEFPAMNSYHRMVIHRVANYFKITRVVDPLQKKIILFKTENSAIPALRFSDLVEEEEEQPVRAVKLLTRNPNRPSSGQANADGAHGPDRRTTSIKEREEAYARARARIFQEDAPTKPTSNDGSGSNSRSDSPSVTVSSATETHQSDPAEDSATRGSKNTRRQQPSGRKAEDDPYPRQSYNSSLPNSRSVSRSTSPSPLPTPGGNSGGIELSGNNGKGGGGNGTGRPKSKHSKVDMASEYAESQRRKSTTSNASSSSARISVGLARTVSASSSQDGGFQSPALIGGVMSESPTVNSPSNNLQKTYDYFGQNPSMNSGSVSPMSSGSSRASMTPSQGPGSKQSRSQNGNNNGASSTGSTGSGGGGGPHASNAGFVKGMNAATFVPKKPYPKQGQMNNSSFNNGGSNGPYNNGFPLVTSSGIPAQGSFYGNNNHHQHSNSNNNISGGINGAINGNGINVPYTQSTAPPNWQDRNPTQGGQDQQFPYCGASTQDQPSSNQGFGYSGQPTQYQQQQLQHQPMQQVPPFGNNHSPYPHHPHQQQQHQRGGRRNYSTQPHFSHQPHFQHPSHARTHPQVQQQQHHHHQQQQQHNQYHTNNNYGGPSASREDYATSQGIRSASRFGRNPMDGNTPSFGPHGPDFNNINNNNSSFQNGGGGGVDLSGSNMYPGYAPQTSVPISNENSGYGQRHMHNQNWGLAGPDPAAHCNPNFQGPAGGKKPYNNSSNKYQPSNTTTMGQQHLSSIITTQGGPSSFQTSQASGGPGYGTNQGGSQGMYDIERRPPKSAELFDPNGGGGQGNGGPGPGDFGFSRQGSSDGAGGYGSNQDGSLISPNNDRGSNGYHGQNGPYSNFNQHHHHHGHLQSNSQPPQQFQQQQPQQPPPNSLSQFPPLQSHLPVAMTRSFSSASSTGGGHTSSPGPGSGPSHQGKKNNLIYDYSVLATPSYDGISKSPSESEKPSTTLSHILEIYDFDATDNIFGDLVLPQGSKLKRLKPSAKEPVGQCLVIFKNGVLANEALVAFLEGKETWMGPEASVSRSEYLNSSAEEEEDSAVSKDLVSGEAGTEEEKEDKRSQRRFNVKIWTPVLVNTTATASAAAGVTKLATSNSCNNGSGPLTESLTPTSTTTATATPPLTPTASSSTAEETPLPE